MDFLKKCTAIFSIATLLAGGALQAQDTEYYEEDLAYSDSYGAQGLSPAVGLGVIALAGIIAVAVNNNDNGDSSSSAASSSGASTSTTTHGHSHGHS